MRPEGYYSYIGGVDRELYATGEEWAASFHLNGPCPENMPDRPSSINTPVPVITQIHW
ncbi:MAG: hypothetical protein NT096_00280 [Proteobacteria bacterium]|nr:hypothetical protein [Pseudomonadota bacterium]